LYIFSNCALYQDTLLQPALAAFSPIVVGSEKNFKLVIMEDYTAAAHGLVRETQEVAQAKQEISEAESKVAEAKQEVAAAEEKVAAAEEKVAAAEEKVAAAMQLVDDAGSDQRKMDRANFTLQCAERALASARSGLESAQEGRKSTQEVLRGQVQRLNRLLLRESGAMRKHMLCVHTAMVGFCHSLL
jgi:predicted  nucleic acid-binding Zn-ribbon protein